jgi:RNA polymerase sigma-70 factor (ECF subfamily)
VIGESFPEVLAAARAGAAWAMERIYADLAGPVTGYLRLQGGREPDDLASDTFLSVLTGIPRFTGDERAFRSWVFTIAHRRLIDERRRSARIPEPRESPEEASGPTAADAADEALARLGTERVVRLCAGLPGDQRAVLLMRVLGDLTIEQVAAVIGKSVGATKALQRRGLAAVRVTLQRDGVPL